MKCKIANSWYTVALAAVICTLPCDTAYPEDLPHWTPAELARHSDLVVIGSQRSDMRISIRKVLKGKWEGKSVDVSNLTEYKQKLSNLFGVRHKKLELSGDVLTFLDLRWGRPKVVANGVYRVGTLGGQPGVLGYWQPMNPGGYDLQPKILFKDLGAIEEAIEAELAEIRKRQANLFEKVKKAKTNDDFRQRLHDLNNITRFGDLDVLTEVVSLPSDGTVCRLGHLYYFVQNVRDPDALVLLEEMYLKTRDTHILQAIGRLGNPASLDFFTKIIEEAKVPKPLFALYGMKELYVALEEKGDQKTCVAIREGMYKHVDKDLMSLMMSAPQLISVIPHQGSIDRLQRAYEHHAKRRSNAEYEIEMHIKRCKEKLLKLKKSDIAQPSAPADADKPRR